MQSIESAQAMKKRIPQAMGKCGIFEIQNGMEEGSQEQNQTAPLTWTSETWFTIRLSFAGLQSVSIEAPQAMLKNLWKRFDFQCPQNGRVGSREPKKQLPFLEDHSLLVRCVPADQ